MRAGAGGFRRTDEPVKGEDCEHRGWATGASITLAVCISLGWWPGSGSWASDHQVITAKPHSAGAVPSSSQDF